MRPRKTMITGLLVITAIGIGSALWLQKDKPNLKLQADFPLMGLLKTSAEAFTQVEAPWQFSFPRDHSAHPHYQTESWYFTGSLDSKQGKRFGFQLSFFRVGLKPPKTAHRPSLWDTREVYRGHFSLTDINQSHFQVSERFSRSALKLSGSSLYPPKIWLENWYFQALEGENSNSFHLQATAHNMRIDLTLHNLKPPFLSGQDPAKQRSTFYAYQLPRLRAQGKVQINQNTYPVEGLAWLDHAWGAIPIPTGPVVWDRFLLQLEDGRDLLGFRLRRRDGSGVPINSGFLIDQNGKIQILDRDNFTIEVLNYWQSPSSKINYPSRWQLRVPDQGLDLSLIPYVNNQELNLTLRYWGGIVKATGKDYGETVEGQGYIELIGYDP
ncbi:lipocalin-like domain-containing protein [Candidatus Nitrosoglobus terrae]|nr:lipocalin-like domain-containing protein [Candidatus Nitrosoglobus terrae]